MRNKEQNKGKREKAMQLIVPGTNFAISIVTIMLNCDYVIAIANNNEHGTII